MTFQTDPDVAELFSRTSPPPAELFDPEVDLQTKVALLRAGSRSGPEALARPFDGTTQDVELELRWGTVPGRVYRPRRTAPGVRGTAVWFYGGGMMLGDIDKAHHDAAELAEVAGVPVVTATYRLAPEHPFPAGVEDAFDAVAFLARNGERLGLPVERLAVAGESAGGAMATAAAMQAREVEDVNVVFQLLAYPKVDFVRRYPCADEMQSVGIPDAMAQVFDTAYLPDPALRSHPLATPLDADLTGMPGGIILSAEGDTIRDEAEEYGRRLRAAGVPVATVRAIGQLHGFVDHTDVSPAARLVTHAAYRALGEALTEPDPAVPVLRPAVRLHVLCAPALEVGEVPEGRRRVIPITGGTWTAVGADGREVRGEVLPGGADWATEQVDGAFRVAARYTIRAEDGSLVDVRNEGWVREGVARTVATLEAPAGSPLAHLARRTLLGTIGEAEGGVLVTLHLAE